MVRRLIIALIVAAAMVATAGVATAQDPDVPPVNPAQGDPGAQQAVDAQAGGASAQAGGASAQAGRSQQQIVGQPYCGPWQQAWYVSSGRWWYSWWWRWCYNPSLPPGQQYYIDWASWNWYGPAAPWLFPGWYYNGPPPF